MEESKEQKCEQDCYRLSLLYMVGDVKRTQQPGSECPAEMYYFLD